MSNGKPDVNLLEQWIEHPSATHVHHEPVSGKIPAKLMDKLKNGHPCDCNCKECK